MYFSVDWFTRICRLTTNHWNQTLQTGSFGFLASFGAAPAAAAPAAPASSANFSKSKASNTAEAAFLFERGIHGSFGGACKAKHLQARFIAHLCISDLCTLTFWIKCTRSGCCISMLTTGWSQDLSHPKRLNPFANWSFCTHQRWQHRRWRVLPPRMMRNRSNMATPLKPRAMQTQQKATQANMQKGGFQNSIQEKASKLSCAWYVQTMSPFLIFLPRAFDSFSSNSFTGLFEPCFALHKGASNTGLRAFSKTKPCTCASSLSNTFTKSRIRNAARVAAAPTCACPGKKKNGTPKSHGSSWFFPIHPNWNCQKLASNQPNFVMGGATPTSSWDHLGLEANSWMPNSLPRPAEGLVFLVDDGPMV